MEISMESKLESKIENKIDKENKERVLALIPARGGSKGIPGKNIKELCGRPLISYTIESALQCECIDAVVVSTDSREIAGVSVKYGAQVPFLRPSELAGDHAKTIDAVLYTIEELARRGHEFDYLILLQPTSPLRTAKDIQSALDLALSTGQDVVGVSKVKESPILMRTREENGTLHRLLDTDSTIRRQDMPVYYRVNGSVYVNKISTLSDKTSFNDNPVGCVIPDEHSIDIDEPADFTVAEYYLLSRGISL